MRRFVLALAIWIGGSIASYAQQAPGRLPVIGWLTPASAASYNQPGRGNPGPQLLRESLAKHGLVDGGNVRLDIRLAEGKLDRLPGLAEGLVRDGATVILAFGEEAVRAAQAATATVPIVSVGDDLVDSGLAASLSKAGSNITGVSILATELDAKKVEVLKDLLPHATRFGVLNDPATSGRQRLQRMSETARHLGIELQIMDIRGPNDVEPAFRALQAARADGVVVVSSAMLTSFRHRLGELSIAARIPAICQWHNMVEAGCLASYGMTLADLYLASAEMIARLLKGARPADLPVQQPTRFELVVSLKTAKALGLTLPPGLLARADDVVE